MYNIYICIYKYVYIYTYVYIYICIFNSCFSYATKYNRYFYHIAFLETCKTFDVLPGGLKITNVPFISFVTDDIKISWHTTTTSTEKDLLETLIFGIEDKRI